MELLERFRLLETYAHMQQGPKRELLEALSHRQNLTELQRKILEPSPRGPCLRARGASDRGPPPRLAASHRKSMQPGAGRGVTDGERRSARRDGEEAGPRDPGANGRGRRRVRLRVLERGAAAGSLPLDGRAEGLRSEGARGSRRRHGRPADERGVRGGARVDDPGRCPQGAARAGRASAADRRALRGGCPQTSSAAPFRCRTYW